MELKNNFIQKILSFKKSKITSDFLLNYISLIFLGLTGLVLNLIIANFYDPSTLGIFNLSITFYFLVSMIGSGGINYSLLNYLSKSNKNIEDIKAIISGSCIPVLFTSLITTLLFFASIIKISNLFNSDDLYKGLISIVPAIFFGSLNKVLLYGIYNGLRKMKEFAFFQTLRYLIILFNLLLFINYQLEGYYIPCILSITEFILFPLMILRINKNISFLSSRKWNEWSIRHLNFGIKAVFTGFISESNTKVDIIMIGFLLNNNDVGVYSFAALFIEGYIILIKVFKDIYNPIFSEKINIIDNLNFSKIAKKVKYRTYAVSATFTIFLLIIYSIFNNLFLSQKNYDESFLPFIILLIGIFFSSGYIPFQEIFAMGDRPLLNSLYMMGFLSFNVIFNLVLIPILGINGAALATSLAYFFAAILISFMTKRYFKINI